MEAVSMTMKKSLVLLLLTWCLFGCTGNAPNVSGIDVNMEVLRFEQDFFAVDTNNLPAALPALRNKYPGFLDDFVHNILGLVAANDTSVETLTGIRRFIHDYKPIKDSADRLFKDFEPIEEEITENLKYVKHYFPNYQLPAKTITFIGPMDAYFEASLGGYGDVISKAGLAVGLQLHLGKNFSIYKSEMGQALYPAYISRRFAPEYIPVNCIKNIVDDMFPDLSTGKHFVIQLVEKGKRMYLLDKFMPTTADTLKIGYTGPQLKGCYENEGLIWNYFLTNGLVYNNDPGVTKNYLGESPNTPEFGEGAPGNIGLFIGWQIVKKYMKDHSDVSLQTLMQMDAKKLFEESKYRPR